jgi:chromosome segregation protein
MRTEALQYICEYMLCQKGSDQTVYLKRLDMLGFKSFALRTVLEFSPGITAVVGPNGSGKSNVADAMRWVLGEQNMRQLRGKKSDDIIFVGGQGRAALGMAEVTLTLDNSTGWVPSEYGEISVTRRSYRSGENEYLINKQKVRLKDVLLLLAQARIGYDSYTVVGQGLIDAALSLRAEERRGLFEDAAENRLKQTAQNLERLRDIVREIEPRLGPLAEQAKKAVEFGQLNKELQESLLAWYGLQWRRLRVVKERTEQAEQAQAQQVKLIEDALKAMDEQVVTLRSTRQTTQGRIGEARKVYGEENNALLQIERDLAVNEERIVGFERQRGDLQQEERRLRERLIAAQKQSIDLEEQCDLADEALDTGASKLAELESQVGKAQKEYEMDERRLRGAQSDLVQVQARLGATQTELGRLQKQLGERNRTLASRRDTIAQAQQSLRTVEMRLVEERARLDAVRSEEQQCSQRKQAIGRAIADAQQEIDRLKGLLAEAERRKRTMSDRLNMLKNWRQSLSGYSDGVRALLRAPAGKLTGLLGPVPQLGVVPVGMELALEAALGQYMQAVVVQRLVDAQQAMNYLQQEQLGKAMIVWLERVEDEGEEEEIDEVDDIQTQVEEAVLQRYVEASPFLHEQVVGFAWQLVQCEPRYRPLFRRLLQGVVVTHNLDAAHDLLVWGLQLSTSSDSDLPFTILVTLKGETLHIAGWLVGGSGKESGQQGMLAYERELRELPQQLTEHNGLLDKINNLISEVQRGQEGRRIEQASSEKELQKIVARINEFTKVVGNSQRELERLQTEIRLAASVEQQLAAEVAGLEQEVQGVQERVSSHEKKQREMSGLVEELQIEIEERATAFRRQQDELGKVRTALAVKRQEARALRQQLSSLQAQAKELKSQVDQQVARIKEAEQRRLALLESVAQQHGQLEQGRARVSALQADLKLIEGKLAEIEQQVVDVEKQRMQRQQRLSEQEAHYRKALLESQRARDAVESLLVQFQEEKGIDNPRELLAQLSSHTQLRSTVPISRSVVKADRASPVPTVYEGASEADRASPVPTVCEGASQSTEESIGCGELSEEEEAALRRYRRKIETLRSRLKAMGGADVNAPQMYEEEKTRYDFLTSQMKDLEQAALHLHSIIGQLDVTMARQFEATFQAVNAQFREHFTTLFNGGSARLELVSARNGEEKAEESRTSSAATSMPSGVDVIVQPPGKKVQDLSLLSGGERALVSAALLFSLLEINPPPFCLLDEVDAALDESNVTRFCDILKRLSQHTQFIVITHNRVTMTVAQAIYGTSMRDSVSRLLSMRLEEIPEKVSS